jgi:hypothetical protein
VSTLSPYSGLTPSPSFFYRHKHWPFLNDPATSIPLSGLLLFQVMLAIALVLLSFVPIPLSGFFLFSPVHKFARSRISLCHNPSFGLFSLFTDYTQLLKTSKQSSQSLFRAFPSLHGNVNRKANEPQILQSLFRDFSSLHCLLRLSSLHREVSIPLSG